MNHHISFKKTNVYSKLVNHSKDMKSVKMKDLFDSSPQRFDEFSLDLSDFLFDYSKNIITKDTISLLIEMAKECHLESAISDMFEGKKINETEQRSVLHNALRNRAKTPVYVEGKDIMPLVSEQLSKIKHLSESIRSKKWRGYTGLPITDVVNIGIGGSDLGPSMVSEALHNYQHENIKTHYISNVDSTQITKVLNKLNRETTLFLIASKTFTTQETMTNANTARNWFLNQGKEGDIAKHFVAISSNLKKVSEFGIAQENVFSIWDWVGGRYSVWSSIGLSISISIGYENFKAFLEGAHEVDNHFKNTPFDKNIPVIMGLLGIWYGNFLGSKTHAVLPYDFHLKQFVSYLQQVDMESNGKSVDKNGHQIDYQTGQIIWGDVGINGQHAFYQLLHQGTHLIPADFIGTVQNENNIEQHQDILMSNFFAQTEALMLGKELPKVVAELIEKGHSNEEVEKLTPFKIFKGNNPTNSILIKKLTPKSLGKLIALYEHKVFVQGILWNVFSFDQWGVELGKGLALSIYKELGHDDKAKTHDSSTNHLINQYKNWKKSN